MITKTISLGAAGVALAVAVGCGGSVTDESNPSGAGGDTSASAGTGGTGAACIAFGDETGPGSPTIRFKNETGMPVYLGGACGAVQYTIQPAAGSDGTAYNFDGTCLQTCEDLVTSPPFACGADCALTSYLVPPGGSHDFVWNGTGLRQGVQMPAACFFQSNGSGTCSQVVAAKPGKYQVQAMGYSACETNCMCNEDGQCFGQATGLQAYADPVTFDFPSTAVVEVVFGVCAFGCAGG